MSSQGFTIHTIVGGRVLGECTYVPAHSKNGKDQSQRITIPVRVNKRNRQDDYKLTVWGPLADTCARSCSPGKLLTVSGESQNYLGDLYNRDRQLRLDQAGQAIQIRKEATTVKHIMFGNESAKQIQEEINTGLRPRLWNVPGTEDAAQWANIIAKKKAAPEMWDGRSAKFGFARVYIPQGVVLKPVAAQPAGAVVNNQGAGLVNQVGNALGGNVQVVTPAEPKYVLQDGTPCTKDGVPLASVQTVVAADANAASGAGVQQGMAY